jgi:hypothetical protein
VALLLALAVPTAVFGGLLAAADDFGALPAVTLATVFRRARTPATDAFATDAPGFADVFAGFAFPFDFVSLMMQLLWL